MADVVKSGWIQRYSKSFLDGGWRKVWVVLHNNSVLKWYKKQTDSDSKGDIVLKEVCKWFSVGKYTEGLPDQPDLPANAKLDHLLAIPVKPSSRAKIIWFLFTNDNELNEWMNAIVSVLPPAPHRSQQPNAAAVSAPYPTVQATHAGTVMAGAGYAVPSAPPQHVNAPPPYSTHAPGYPQQAAYPQQAGYSQQQPHYPAQTGYPQQAGYSGYPQQAAYPQQAYYPQQPVAYAQAPPPPPPGYAAAYPGYYPQQGPYYGNTGNPQVIHVKEKKGSNIGEIALGVAGGALLAHGATSMMGGWGCGGGWGGGWGLGHHGSWSSLSSLSSFSSCGSFGSFGSFD